MSFRLENKLRPLRIRFEICHDNEDYDFRSELVSLMISSIRELRSAANVALQARDGDLFRRAVHKSKSTLVLLDDSEFYHHIENFRDQLMSTKEGSSSKDDLRASLHLISEISEDIIESLHEECARLKALARSK